MTEHAKRHSYAFHTPQEERLVRNFLTHGHVILDVEDAAALDSISSRVVASVTDFLGLPGSHDRQALLNDIHLLLPQDQLNALRLRVIADLRSDPDWFLSSYYSLARNALSVLVGNELAIQRSVGLSVQLPDDASSLLPIHADVWDGDSPFEVVLWLPLVDCHGTKSMYIVDLAKDRELQATVGQMRLHDAEGLFQAVRDHVTFLDVPYGKVLLFSQTVMHGNRINTTRQTRWSMNCRFKSLLSPYADKKLIETFQPLTLRAATRLGMSYRMPTLSATQALPSTQEPEMPS